MIMTKKRLGCLILLLLVPALLLVMGAPATEAAPKGPSKRVEMRVDGGPPGTSSNLRREGIGEAIRMGNPSWDVSVIVGPSSPTDLVMMSQRRMEVAAKTNGEVQEVKKGLYGGKPLATGPLDLTWVAPSNFARVIFFMLADVPINSIQELKERKYPLKVSVGPLRSPIYHRTIETLRAYGITLEDIKEWGGKVHYQPSTRSASMMGDGIIEAFFMGGTVPTAPLEQLSVTRKLKVLTPTQPAARESLKKLGYIEGVLPAGSHSFITKDIPTMMMSNLVVVRADMNEDIAYHITRAIWENRGFLKNVHPVFQRSLTAESIKSMAKEFSPILHPGARKYYREQGLLE
jgi:TRAP transporter TAXI family solute receptor